MLGSELTLSSRNALKRTNSLSSPSAVERCARASSSTAWRTAANASLHDVGTCAKALAGAGQGEQVVDGYGEFRTGLTRLLVLLLLLLGHLRVTTVSPT